MIYTTYDVNLYSPEADAEIRITEDGDGLDLIYVRTQSDFWGKMDFSVSVEDAEALANGILKAVKFIKEKQ